MTLEGKGQAAKPSESTIHLNSQQDQALSTQLFHFFLHLADTPESSVPKQEAMLLGTSTLGLKQSQQRMMLEMRQWEAGSSRSKGHRFCVMVKSRITGAWPGR